MLEHLGAMAATSCLPLLLVLFASSGLGDVQSLSDSANRIAAIIINEFYSLSIMIISSFLYLKCSIVDT